MENQFAQAFNAWQNSGKIHPFTCGKNSDHILVYRNNRLECPKCDYTQEITPQIFSSVMSFGKNI